MTYRIYKRNGIKCIRKFDNLDDAKTWVWLREDCSQYRIEFQYENESEPRSIYF